MIKEMESQSSTGMSGQFQSKLTKQMELMQEQIEKANDRILQTADPEAYKKQVEEKAAAKQKKLDDELK